jgi:hypothetical protein
MTNYPYLLFNQSPEQLRRIGARGGKAQARNRRARQQAPAQVQPQTLAVIHPLAETAAQASRVLDAQFPWLRGAEKRCAPRASAASDDPGSSSFPTFARRRSGDRRARGLDAGEIS